MAPAKRRKYEKLSLDRPGIVKCVAENFESWLEDKSGKEKLVVLVAGCFIRGPFRSSRHGLAATLYKEALEHQKLKDSGSQVFMLFTESDAHVAQQLSDALMELKEEYKDSSANVKYMIINLEFEPAINWVIGNGFQFCESGKSIFTPPALPLERLITARTPFKLITDSEAVPDGDISMPIRQQIFDTSADCRITTAWFNGKSKYERVQVDGN